MATLTIRNVPDETQRALRLRAAQNQRSVEAEVRALIEAAMAGRAGGDWRAELDDVRAQARAAFGDPPKGTTARFVRERRVAWGED